MSPNRTANYSQTQILLHWAVAFLVIFQLIIHEGMEHAFDAIEDGEVAAGGDVLMANVHVAAGILIFVFAVWRVALRFRRGAPPLPEGEHPALKAVANGTHFLLYALIIGMPITGAGAWFLKIEIAAEIHEAAKTLMIALVVLHTAAALAQHFIFKTDVLKRMLKLRSEA